MIGTKDKTGLRVYIIQNPSKNGVVIIGVGAFKISFIEKNGKIYKTNWVRYDKQVLDIPEDLFIPAHIYNPAAKIAYAVFADYRKRKERKKHKARQKSLF